jgi:hypothetical protein
MLGTSYLWATLIGSVAMALAGTGATAADSPTKKTIGLALLTSPFAVYETADGKQECPEGLHTSNRDNWKMHFPTEEARNAFTEARIHLGPRSAGNGNVPENYLQARGPAGQHIGYNPTLVKDLPLREVQSKVAYGLNLDGTTDGRATANTCKHEKFTAADGAPVAVDNQLYRVYGCAVGWRKGGYIGERRSTEVRNQILNRMLFEISDVDDERNDPEVVVTAYKGIDRIELDGAGNALSGTQQRIDVRYTKYVTRTKGKIVDGVLTTEPVDQYMPLFQIQTPTERFVRGMRLQLKLTPTGAEGLLAGYENLKQWWSSYVASYSRTSDTLATWDPPATYEAAHRLADGYPDPQTGKCTAISSAWRVTMVRSDIVRPRRDDPLVLDASFKAAQQTVSPSPADGS